MRLLRMLTAIIAGTIAVVWVFATFIVRDHHVHMTQQSDSEILYSVDDGKTFSSPEACVQHCKSRRGWNLRNTISISTDGSVSTNDLQYLGDLMLFYTIYPTTLETQQGGDHVIREYRPGSYLEDFREQRQQERQRNANSERLSVRRSAHGKPLLD